MYATTDDDSHINSGKKEGSTTLATIVVKVAFGKAGKEKPATNASQLQDLPMMHEKNVKVSILINGNSPHRASNPLHGEYNLVLPDELHWISDCQ
jgi:hypothetical protein